MREKTLLMDAKEEGIEEGIKEGIKEERENTLKEKARADKAEEQIAIYIKEIEALKSRLSVLEQS